MKFKYTSHNAMFSFPLEKAGWCLIPSHFFNQTLAKLGRSFVLVVRVYALHSGVTTLFQSFISLLDINRE